MPTICRLAATDNFLLDQFLLGANPFTFPLWIAGLYFYSFSRSGRPYRMLGWMYLVPLLFFGSQGPRVLSGPGVSHAAGCRGREGRTLAGAAPGLGSEALKGVGWAWPSALA